MLFEVQVPPATMYHAPMMQTSLFFPAVQPASINWPQLKIIACSQYLSLILLLVARSDEGILSLGALSIFPTTQLVRNSN